MGKNALTAAPFIAYFPVMGAAKDNPLIQGVLSIAKMTVACGILDSMMQMKKTTKIPEANKFFARFWSVEAA